MSGPFKLGSSPSRSGLKTDCCCWGEEEKSKSPERNSRHFVTSNSRPPRAPGTLRTDKAVESVLAEASSFVQGSLSLGPQKTDATEMRMASQSSSSAKGGAVAGQATILTQFFYL